MHYFKIILRFIFGTVTTLWLIMIVGNIFKSDMADFAAYILAYLILFVQIPSAILLILVSTYTFLTKRIFWSLFKIEYYFLIISLSPIMLNWVYVTYIK
jgi:hypothetical protein